MLLAVKDAYAEPVRRALSPLHQAWARIAQRRFTARGRAGIVSFPLGDNLPAMMVRRYVHGGLFARIGRDLYWGPERAMTELMVTEAARSGGVSVPEPIGALAQRAYGPFWRLAFLSLEVPESEDLIHYCCRLSEYPPETVAVEKRGVIREAALQIRRMHDLGIYHADLHLKNLLLQRRPAKTAKVYVIDFDRAARGSPLNVEQRAANLKRLARSICKVRVADAVLSAWDRLRFLRAYLEGRPEARALLRRWAKSLAAPGAARRMWWTMTAAQRSIQGDQVQMARSLRRNL